MGISYYLCSMVIITVLCTTNCFFTMYILYIIAPFFLLGNSHSYKWYVSFLIRILKYIIFSYPYIFILFLAYIFFIFPSFYLFSFFFYLLFSIFLSTFFTFYIYTSISYISILLFFFSFYIYLQHFIFFTYHLLTYLNLYNVIRR